MSKTHRLGAAIAFCLICLGCLTRPMAGTAMDLQEMIAAAIENDARLKSLSSILTNTLLSIERAELAPGFQVKLSTGTMRFGYSFKPEDGDPPWLVSIEPSGTLLLGRRTETQINVGAPLAVEFGDGTEVAALPKLSIRQPLDKLFGGKKFTEVQDWQNRYAAEKARIDVLKRIQEIERQLVGQLRVIVELEGAGRQLEYDLAEASDAFEQVVRLKSHPVGSVQHRQLEFSVQKLKREIEFNKLQHGRAWQDLERMIGKPVKSLPENLPEAELLLPAVEEAERNPEVYLATLYAGVENARLKEEREPARPEFYLGGSVESHYNEVKDRTYTTVGGTVEGVFDDFSVSAGVGGILETGTVFLSVGLSLTIQDSRIESINLKERENALEGSRWNVAAVRDAFLSAREMLALEIQELELRRRSLEEDRSLIDQRLAETEQWLAQGFSTPKEVNELRRQREKLDSQFQALRLDSLIIRCRLDALVAIDEVAP